MIYDGLIAGIVAGTIRSIYGWLGSDELFNAKKFTFTLIRTVLIGATLGFSMNGDPFNIFFQVFFSDTILKESYEIGKERVDKQ